MLVRLLRVVVISLFVIIITSSSIYAIELQNKSISDNYPSEYILAAWEYFVESHPGAQVLWGRKFQRPYVIFGFTPIETDGNFDSFIRSFIDDNPQLFGLDKLPEEHEVLAQLGSGEIIYQCRNDELEPLPGLTDEEVIEPDCPEVTIVKFPQYVNGYRIQGTSFGAIFDSKNRLIGIQGEHLGVIPLYTWPVVTLDDANLILQYNLDREEDEFDISNVEMYYRFIDELVPVWQIELSTFDNPQKLTVIINAWTGDVIEIDDGIDYSEETVWGYTMDNKAAYLCNEPALRDRQADNQYVEGNQIAAFNNIVHVYDLKTLNADTFYPNRSNDRLFLIRKFFHYRCDPDDPNISGDTCENSDGETINLWDISTYTAFVQAIYAYNYVTNFGFNRNGGTYPNNTPLVAIIDKPESVLCGGNDISCFSTTGYPLGEVGDANHYSPSETEDQYEATPTPENHPTIVMKDNAIYNIHGSPPQTIYKPSNHVHLYHEFYHYVIRRYMPGGGYELGVDEQSAINEGFAQYFASSIIDEGPENFHRSSMPCRSDEYYGSTSMNMQYTEVFSCCYDTHDGGHVITQILWDLRDGVPSTIEQMKKVYTNKLLVASTVRLGLDNVETLDDLHDSMFAIAANELSGQCLIGNNAACQANIHSAFIRLGMCWPRPCSFLSRECDGVLPSLNCDGIACYNGANMCTEDSTIDVSNCGINDEEEPDCCYDVCDNQSIYNCGIFANEASCLADCIGNLWSYDYRSHLRYEISYPDGCDE